MVNEKSANFPGGDGVVDGKRKELSRVSFLNFQKNFQRLKPQFEI